MYTLIDAGFRRIRVHNNSQVKWLLRLLCKTKYYCFVRVNHHSRYLDQLLLLFYEPSSSTFYVHSLLLLCLLLLLFQIVMLRILIRLFSCSTHPQPYYFVCAYVLIKTKNLLLHCVLTKRILNNLASTLHHFFPQWAILYFSFNPCSSLVVRFDITCAEAVRLAGCTTVQMRIQVNRRSDENNCAVSFKRTRVHFWSTEKIAFKVW